MFETARQQDIYHWGHCLRVGKTLTHSIFSAFAIAIPHTNFWSVVVHVPLQLLLFRAKKLNKPESRSTQCWRCISSRRKVYHHNGNVIGTYRQHIMQQSLKWKRMQQWKICRTFRSGTVTKVFSEGNRSTSGKATSRTIWTFFSAVGKIKRFVKWQRRPWRFAFF